MAEHVQFIGTVVCFSLSTIHLLIKFIESHIPVIQIHDAGKSSRIRYFPENNLLEVLLYESESYFIE